MSTLVKKSIWKISRTLYIHFFNPILSIASIDKGHHFMIAINRIISRSNLVTQFIRLLYKNKPNKILSQKIHGIDFIYPVGLPAGYDKSGNIIPIIASLGFGFGTIGSVTADPCEGNPKPWIYRLPKAKSLVVNAGLCNDGVEKVMKRIERYNLKSLKDFPVIISVAKTNSQKVVRVQEGIADNIETIRLAKKEKLIKIIELNISCPNTHGGEPFTTPERLELLLKKVDAENLKQPIFIKMPVDFEWNNFKQLLDVAIKHKVCGVTIANLTKDRIKAGSKDNLPDRIRGNFSGKSTWELSNNLIRKTYQHYGNKLTIIGVGGIFSAEDAYEKIKLGASLVELVTGMMYYGPQLPSEVNEGLIKLLKKDGYSHIGQAIGINAFNKSDGKN